MANRKRRKNGGSGFGRVIISLIVLGGLVAFFKIPADPSAHGILEATLSRADQVKAFVTGTTNKISSGKDIIIGNGKGSTDSSTSTGSGWSSSKDGKSITGTTISKSDELSKLDKIKTIPSLPKVAYNRTEWKHWIAQGSSCWNTRDAVLYRDAVKGSVVLKNASGKTVSNVKDACTVSSGKWIDPYTGDTVTSPTKLDIDHSVSLGNAAASGGQSWSATKKMEYANYLNYKTHLLAVGSSANRQKGDGSVADWVPSNKGYWCQYATTQIDVKSKWGLTVTKAEKEKLTSMIKTCK